MTEQRNTLPWNNDISTWWVWNPPINDGEIHCIERMEFGPERGSGMSEAQIYCMCGVQWEDCDPYYYASIGEVEKAKTTPRRFCSGCLKIVLPQFVPPHFELTDIMVASGLRVAADWWEEHDEWTKAHHSRRLAVIFD